MLQGFSNTNFVGLPGIRQSGIVPADARSISFLTSTSSFYTAGRLQADGVDVPLFAVGDNRLAGDLSAFAGKNVELMVSTIPGQGWFYFDDVQFSTAVVPEPSACALGAFALIVFVLFIRPRHVTAPAV